MNKQLKNRFRPALFDSLEDRAVPSSPGVGQVQNSGATVGSSTTSYATRLARLQVQLTTAGTQVNAAYDSFANSIRSLEQGLIVQTPPTSSVLPSITSLVNALASSVQTAYASVSNIGSGAAVIAASLNGGSAGSLSNQLTSMVNAASISDSVTKISLPLLFSAVEGALSFSLQSTSIEGLLAGLGAAGFTPPKPAGASPFSLTTFGTQTNEAFGTFASSIRSTELNLPTSTGGTASSLSIAGATDAGAAASDTLASTLASSLRGTTAEFFAALQQPEEMAGFASFGTLLNNAAYEGAVLTVNLPLVYTVGEVAINATYDAVAIQGYLISTIA